MLLPVFLFRFITVCSIVDREATLQPTPPPTPWHGGWGQCLLLSMLPQLTFYQKRTLAFALYFAASRN